MTEALQNPPPWGALSIGSVAARLLHAGGTGRVAAVFERSCYVQIGSGMLCIGPHGLGNGPLNLLIENQLPPIARDAPTVTKDKVLTIGRSFACDLRSMTVWSPAPVSTFCAASLRDGLQAFQQALPVTLPADGLVRLLLDSTADRSAVISAALAAAQHLRDFAGSHENPTGSDLGQQLTSLLGLGPGLTPSGDDYLGGSMIAFTLLRQNAKRDVLWHALEPKLPSHTTTISAAHLAAAAEGLGSEALHHLLGDILAGGTKSLPQALAAVAAIGHTSGWDALAGAVAVFRASLDAPPACLPRAMPPAVVPPNAS